MAIGFVKARNVWTKIRDAMILVCQERSLVGLLRINTREVLL